MIIFILILSVSYLTFILFLWHGWQSLPTEDAIGDRDELPFITVVIPVRNEAANIEDLLQNLSRQKYPTTNFEVIIVDDHSTDNTAEIVTRWQHEMGSDIQMLLIASSAHSAFSPKKAAILQAVELAKGSIVVTTDGDCSVGVNWLGTLSSQFKQRDAVFVAGLVVLTENGNFWQGLQQLEFASLTGSAFGIFSYGIPLMCNGANLAFRKDAFEAIGGFEGNESIASGDDVFLLQKFHSAYPEKVFFQKSAKAIVKTAPQTRPADFIQQRIRWAGKWSEFSCMACRIIPVLLFCWHLSYVLAMAALLLNGEWFWLSILTGSKFLSEYLFLNRVMKDQQERLHFLPFIVAALFYSVYAVAAGLLANVLSFKWKGRRFEK